jgi:hypothetical protein
VVLSRRRPLWERANPIKLTEPLRIQLIVSAPIDETLEAVAYKEVETTLQQLAEAHPNKIASPLETVHRPTIPKIEAALEERRPHIVHLIGHGRLRQARGVAFGELALVNAAGRVDWKTDEEIGQIFQVHGPAVVLLQACEGGRVGGAFIGVASQIVQRNVPAVVGMQYTTSNQVAVTFAEAFYRRLGELEPVDAAVQRGRRLLSQRFPRTRAYASPVLFMRVEDGRLFETPEAATANAPDHRGASMSTAPESGTVDRVRLLEQINKYFNLSELKDLCFYLHVEYDNLAGAAKRDKVRELIAYFERHRDLRELVNACQKQRPHVTFG